MTRCSSPSDRTRRGFNRHSNGSRASTMSSTAFSSPGCCAGWTESPRWGMQRASPPRRSSRISACWRELAARAGIDLLVFNFASQYDTAFSEQLLSGLNHRLLPADAPDAAAAIRKIILEHQADVVSLSGWVFRSYLQLAADPALKHIHFVMAMDTPLVRSCRQPFPPV